MLNELRAREVELNRQRAELSTEFGERHPRMQNLRSEQAALEERKRAEIRQITNRLSDEVQVLRSREATLRPASTASRRRWPSTRRPRSGSSAAARRRRRPQPARDLHQPRQGDRLAAEGAGARRADHLARDHARRADLSAPRADLRRGLARRAADRLARGVRARAARPELPQLGADRGADRPADARPGAGGRGPREALRLAAGLRARQPELAVRRGGAQPAHGDAADQHGRAAEDRAADLVDPGRGQDLDGDVPRPGPCALGPAHADHRLRRAPAAAARAHRRRQPGRAQRRAAAAARARRGGAVRRALGGLFRDRGRAGARSGGAAGLGPHAPAAQGRRERATTW